MGLNEGRNSGITGIIDVPGQSACFEVWARGHSTDLNSQMLDVAGRGDSEWTSLWPGNSSGFVTVGGAIQLNGWPLPDHFRGESGTLLLQQHTGVTITLSVRVKQCTLNKKDQEQGLWGITLVCQIIDTPELAGFPGDQPVIDDETLEDREIWAGLVKVVDPNVLQSGDTQEFRWWGIGDDDDSEYTKIAAFLEAAVQPFTGMKLRIGTLRRLSYMACSFVVTWGLTDTKDDIEFPNSVSHTETSGLFDTAKVTKVLTDPSMSPPDVPDGINAQLTAVDLVKLNDGRWQQTSYFGSLTEKQRLEFEDAAIESDASSISDRDTQVIEASSSTPPATPDPRVDDLQFVRRVSLRVGGTPEAWTHRFVFERNTTTDKIEFDGTKTTTDVNTIEESATVRQVTNSATPPEAPDAPVGQLLETETQPLTAPNGTYSGFWQHTFGYGPTTKQQKIEFAGDLIVDPSQLKDSDVIPVVASSSTAPETPTLRTADLKLVRRKANRIQGTPELWVHTFEFARNDAQDELELENTRTSTDPDEFAQTARIGVIHDSATSPAAPSAPVGEHVGTEVVPLTVPSGDYTGLWIHIFQYGATTKKEEIEQQGGFTIDPAALDDDDTQTLTSDSSTAPDAPDARISGQVLVRRMSRKLQSAPEKWEHKYLFGYRASDEKLIADKSRTITDPSELEDEAFTAAIYTGTPPDDPDPPTGLVLFDYQDINTKNPAWMLRVYHWRRTTREQQLEYEASEASADPLGVSDTSIASVVDLSGSLQDLADSLLASNQADVTFLGVKVKPLTPGKAVQVLRFSGADKALHSASNHASREAVRGVPLTAIVDGNYLPGNISTSDHDAIILVNWTPGTGLVARPLYIWRALGRFTFRRIYATDSMPDFQYLAVRGNCNSTNFLGYSQGEVMYAGPSSIYTFAIDGVRRLIIDYEFQTDNFKFFNDGFLPEGQTYSSLGIESSGLYSSTSFEAGYVCNFPGQSDFSGFST